MGPLGTRRSISGGEKQQRAGLRRPPEPGGRQGPRVRRPSMPLVSRWPLQRCGRWGENCQAGTPPGAVGKPLTRGRLDGWPCPITDRIQRPLCNRTTFLASRRPHFARSARLIFAFNRRFPAGSLLTPSNAPMKKTPALLIGLALSASASAQDIEPAVNRALGLTESDVQKLEWFGDPATGLTIPFELNGTSTQLALSAHSVRAPGFELVEQRRRRVAGQRGPGPRGDPARHRGVDARTPASPERSLEDGLYAPHHDRRRLRVLGSSRCPASRRGRQPTPSRALRARRRPAQPTTSAARICWPTTLGSPASRRRPETTRPWEPRCSRPSWPVTRTTSSTWTTGRP